MTPDTATPNTQPTKPNTPSATTTARKRQSPIVKFPARFHMAISIPMAESLQRLTGSNSLLAEADIGRLALNAYLMANDPHYARVMRGSSNA
jgi:hypothetical protein